MNCTESKKNIDALLDGELSGFFKDELEKHFLKCGDCREMKEQMFSLSAFLRTSRIAPPTVALDERVLKSFRQRRKKAETAVSWRRYFFGAFAVPKPVFALLLVMVLGAVWTAYQIGKTNSAIVSLAPPPVEIPVQIPSESEIKTIVVEIPVVKEKIVTRTVFIREKKDKTEKTDKSQTAETNNLSAASSVRENGYFTDVNLKGFEPQAEIGARIFKKEKTDEQ